MEFTRPSNGNFEKEIIAALNRIADAVERISPPGPATAKASNEAKAIAALTIFGPNITKIADEIGVNRSTLYRYTNFMDAHDNIVAESERRKRKRRRRTERGQEE